MRTSSSSGNLEKGDGGVSSISRRGPLELSSICVNDLQMVDTILDGSKQSDKFLPIYILEKKPVVTSAALLPAV